MFLNIFTIIICLRTSRLTLHCCRSNISQHRFCLSLSLAELEKEVNNIRSGLKALEAVSRPSLPFLSSLILFWTRGRRRTAGWGV